MNVMNGEFYSKPTWPGALFLQRGPLVIERATYICLAGQTTPHSHAGPKIYAALTGGLSVKVTAWTEVKSSGERRCVPSKNRRKRGVTWKRRERTVKLEPGRLALVMSNYKHQLIGKGVLAIFYPLLDGEGGQWALTRGDYDRGLAVITPPRAEMEDLLGRLSALLADPAGVADAAAVGAMDRWEALLAPASGARVALDPEAADLALKVRKRCRLRRFQCERNARLYLRSFARRIGTTPRKLEETFRTHFKTSVCSFVRFLRHASAMEYYARDQRLASLEGRAPIGVTELSQEVHYQDGPQFSNHFRSFHGISPVMFYPNTYFRLIDGGAAMSLPAAA